MISINDDDLPLQRAYRWERERAGQVFLTQPTTGTEVRDFTWAQAMDEARRLAAWIQAQGWEPGARVAIMSKNTAWWIMADLGIWMAGCVSVPIYPNLVTDTVRAVLQHSDSRAVIVGKLDDWKSMVAGIPEGLTTLSTPLCEAPCHASWDEVMQRTAPLTGHPTFPAQQLATIIYTSGTTGMPKGAMHGFASFAYTAKSVEHLLNSSSEERALSYLPLAHVAERCLIEGHAFRLGYRIYFCRSLTTFLTDLQRARPTFFFSVPRMWMTFQQGVNAKVGEAKLKRLLSIPLLKHFVRRKVLKQLGLEHARFAGSGAAPMPPEVMEWYQSLGLELLEAYGMTEQFAMATNAIPKHSRAGTVGRPASCCEVRLSPEGEVQTRGPAHMLGYFKEPEQSASAWTPDGWLRTGDLGSWDHAQRLRIVGRVKEQFKTSKGKYVSPAPIESRLSLMPAIESVMVSGMAYPQPFALVVLKPEAVAGLRNDDDKQALQQQLRAHLKLVNRELDPHERLDFLAVVTPPWTVESGFITPTLKLRRHAIEQHFQAHYDAWSAQRKQVVWHQG